MSILEDSEQSEKIDKLLAEAQTIEAMFRLLTRCASLEFGNEDSHIIADLVMVKLLNCTFRLPYGGILAQVARCIKEEWWHA